MLEVFIAIKKIAIYSQKATHQVSISYGIIFLLFPPLRTKKLGS